MKRSISGWNRCIEVVHDAHKFIAILVIVPLCMGSVAALAADARLSFSGHISNPTCVVSEPVSSQTQKNTRTLQVSAHMTLVVDTSRNACADAVIPFSTQFQPLPASLFTRSTLEQTSQNAGNGVLTLTYQ